jgi:hypothetical protein
MRAAPALQGDSAMNAIRRIRIRPAAGMILAAALDFGAAARAETSAAFILQALQAEQKAPRKQIDLAYKNGRAEVRFVMTRILPDRMNFVVAPANGPRQ